MRLDMKLGATKQQVAILAGLVLLGGYVFYTNMSSGDEGAPVAVAPAPVVKTPARGRDVPRPTQGAVDQRAVDGGPVDQGARVFRPTMKFKTPPDPLKIDPTLRTDLIDRVRNTPGRLAWRNVFEFATAPPPPMKPIPKVTIPTNGAMVGANTGPPPPMVPQGPPPPPRIPLKFVGFVAEAQGGNKRAFFTEGDDVFVGAEGELIRRRYKVIRINFSSVDMEDTETKSVQKLPLEQAREV